MKAMLPSTQAPPIASNPVRPPPTDRMANAIETQTQVIAKQALWLKKIERNTDAIAHAAWGLVWIAIVWAICVFMSAVNASHTGY